MDHMVSVHHFITSSSLLLLHFKWPIEKSLLIVRRIWRFIAEDLLYDMIYPYIYSFFFNK